MKEMLSTNSCVNSTVTKNRVTDLTRTPLRHVFILLAALLFLPQIMYAQTAKAVYGIPVDGEFQETAETFTLYFIYDDIAYNSTNHSDDCPTSIYKIRIKDGQEELFKYKSSKVVPTNPNYGPQADQRAPWRTATYTISSKTYYYWRKTDRIVFTESFKGFSPTNFNYWFQAGTGRTGSDTSNQDWTTELTTVEGGYNLNTSNTTSLNMMFHSCEKLKSIDDVSNWLPEGNKVKTLHAMFSGCKVLEKLNVDNWYTSNLETSGDYGDLRHVFSYCETLTQLNINTKKVEKEDGTWYMAWDVSKAKSMFCMLKGCTGLTSLDLSKWTPTNVTTTESMFEGCTNLRKIDFGCGWNTPALTTANNMFKDCSSLISLDLSKSDLGSKKPTVNGMFYGCTNLERILCRDNWNTKYSISSSNSANMFLNCNNLEGGEKYSEHLANYNAGIYNKSKVQTSPYNIFRANPDHANTDGTVGGYFTPPVGYAILTGDAPSQTLTFYGGYPEDLYPGGENIDYWLTDDTGTDVPGWYANNSNITTVVFEKSFSSTLPTSCYKWFDGCSNLTTVTDMANLPTHAVTNMEDMFNGCSSLKRIDVSSWNTASLTNMKQTFYGCSSLTSLTFGADFSTANLDLTVNNSTFAGCPKLRYLDFYASSADNNTELNDVVRSSQYNFFYDVPLTTVVYLPENTTCTYSFNTALNPNAAPIYDARKNIVATWQIVKSNNYGSVPIGGSTSTTQEIGYCTPQYYSEDKVDIELPREFKTYKAVYNRLMSNEYGSAILPYAFTKNDDVQPYKLDEQYADRDIMHFTDVSTVPAHTSFAFKKLNPEANEVTFTMNSSNISQVLTPSSGTGSNIGSILINGNITGGITVEATRSTNANEDTWTGEKGSPYEDTSNINQESNLGDWITRGYYVTEIFNNTVTIGNEPYYVYYIGTKDGEDQLLRADGKTRAYPHRVHFLKKKSSSNGAKSYNLDFGMGDDNIGTAIEAAEREKTIREAKAIYDMQGRQQNSLRKGVNIIRMTDGMVKKVIVK